VFGARRLRTAGRAGKNAAMKRLPLPAAVHRLLLDEERAASVLIWGAGGIGALCFVAALLAIELMK
jgi:threonine dehydrogenase-like Zn-dependent dehydrogenase